MDIHKFTAKRLVALISSETKIDLQEFERGFLHHYVKQINQRLAKWLGQIPRLFIASSRQKIVLRYTIHKVIKSFNS
jgi:hypothetical protein